MVNRLLFYLLIGTYTSFFAYGQKPVKNLAGYNMAYVKNSLGDFVMIIDSYSSNELFSQANKSLQQGTYRIVFNPKYNHIEHGENLSVVSANEQILQTTIKENYIEFISDGGNHLFKFINKSNLTASDEWLLSLALVYSPHVSRTAPKFNLTSIDGVQLSNESLKNKVALFLFDSSFTDKNVFGELSRIHQNYSKYDVEIIFMSEASDEVLHQIKEKYNLTYHLVRSKPNTKIQFAYKNFMNEPMYVIKNANNNLVFWYLSDHHNAYSILSKELNSMLKK
jgi:peroxiredoxin